MPRVARTVVPGVPHHITQRGNNRQDVFFTDDDRRAYLTLLGERAAAYGLKILGFRVSTRPARFSKASSHVRNTSHPTDSASLHLLCD